MQNIIVLVWQETGGPRIASISETGFGSSVMRTVVERGLRGTIETDVIGGGICRTITMPRVPAEDANSDDAPPAEQPPP